ncbi:hypothetical protein [Marinobacterium stanieri]|uniref:Uncharacterized protein n=1 Tax=Marinobacterium stanieri TaxID=49186 RepID=A0A1N6N8A6_9GAMM|nr:hypothetical protein [Marinobacterium stanieri]SIP88290.1 hypothetical protein SAMN05421647_101119 [Marinobacterium stanieri]
MRPVDQSFTFSWRSEIEKAINAESSIPSDAKQAIKDFIIEKLDDIKSFSENLLDFPVTDIVETYWPVVVEIIKGLGIS